MMETTCSQCRGEGQIVKDPCKRCLGAGILSQEKKISVKIPAGVEDGMRIRLSGEGDTGPRGGASGDLYILLHLKEHGLFQRDGADIHCRIPVPMVHAALGSKLNVPTMEGADINVEITPGTQHGDKIKIKGKGMPIYGQKRHGDMFVHVAIEVPKKLSKKQEEALRKFEEGCNAAHHPESTSFWGKVKQLWGDKEAS